MILNSDDYTISRLQLQLKGEYAILLHAIRMYIAKILLHALRVSFCFCYTLYYLLLALTLQLHDYESSDQYQPSSGDDSSDNVTPAPVTETVVRATGRARGRARGQATARSQATARGQATVSGQATAPGQSTARSQAAARGQAVARGQAAAGRGRGRGCGRQARVDPATILPVDGWRKTSDVDPPEVIGFTAPYGMTTPLPADSRPIAFFEQMFGNNFFEKLAVTTNDNAATKAPPPAGSTAATSDKNWTPTNAIEMQVFIAINVIMGLNDESEYADY